MLVQARDSCRLQKKEKGLSGLVSVNPPSMSLSNCGLFALGFSEVRVNGSVCLTLPPFLELIAGLENCSVQAHMLSLQGM